MSGSSDPRFDLASVLSYNASYVKRNDKESEYKESVEPALSEIVRTAGNF
jgi:hypothetical protein